ALLTPTEQLAHLARIRRQRLSGPGFLVTPVSGDEKQVRKAVSHFAFDSESDPRLLEAGKIAEQRGRPDAVQADHPYDFGLLDAMFRRKPWGGAHQLVDPFAAVASDRSRRGLVDAGKFRREPIHRFFAHGPIRRVLAARDVKNAVGGIPDS